MADRQSDAGTGNFLAVQAFENTENAGMIRGRNPDTVIPHREDPIFFGWFRRDVDMQRLLAPILDSVGNEVLKQQNQRTDVQPNLGQRIVSYHSSAFLNGCRESVLPPRALSSLHPSRSSTPKNHRLVTGGYSAQDNSSVSEMSAPPVDDSPDGVHVSVEPNRFQDVFARPERQGAPHFHQVLSGTEDNNGHIAPPALRQ